MARMRCYSPRTGYDHGTGVEGLRYRWLAGPRRGGFGILLGAFPARAARATGAARTVGAAWLRPDPAEPGRPPVPPAEQDHRARHQDGADDERVHQHAERQPHPDVADLVAARAPAADQ